MWCVYGNDDTLWQVRLNTYLGTEAIIMLLSELLKNQYKRGSIHCSVQFGSSFTLAPSGRGGRVVKAMDC